MAKLRSNPTPGSTPDQPLPAAVGRGGPAESRPAAPKATGLTLVTPARVAELPRLDREPPFIYAHKPDAESSWHVLAGQLVPRLVKKPIIPGISGAKVKRLADRTYTTDARLTMDNLRNKGYTLIPHDVDGPGTSYMVAVDTDKGTTYVDAWQTPYQGSTRITVDLEGYVAWCASLVERGIIAPPPLWVLEALETGIAALLMDPLYEKASPDLRAQWANDRAVVRSAIARCSEHAVAAPAAPAVLPGLD